jgi:hypothetical protein
MIKPTSLFNIIKQNNLLINNSKERNKILVIFNQVKDRQIQEWEVISNSYNSSSNSSSSSSRINTKTLSFRDNKCQVTIHRFLKIRMI